MFGRNKRLRTAHCSDPCHLQLSEATGIPLATLTQPPTVCTSHPGLEPRSTVFWQARAAPSWPGAGQAIAGWFGRFPAGTEFTRGHLPPGSAVVRPSGEDPRRRPR